MNNLPINLMLSVLLFVGITALVLFVQLKLSQSKSKYLGLILPVLSFLYSLMIVLSLAAFTVSTITLTETSVVSVIDEQTGETIEESEELTDEPEQIVEVREVDSNLSGFMQLAFIFLVSNIPTVVLGGIYVNERNKIKMNSEIEKMKISDL